MVPHITLVLSLLCMLTQPAWAGSLNKGETCSTGNNKLQIGTYAFYSDCDTHTYCDGTTNTCQLKGCRKDEFPFGYNVTETLPPRCERGEFCPDEQDACQPVIPVGQPCQFNRDDQCEAPPNFKELRDDSGRGLNVNGSVCLNYQCYWANVTAGDDCIVENTAYIAYDGTNEFIDIVSRGNCKVGLYCDAGDRKCHNPKALGETCDADKECVTFNCGSDGKCGKDAADPEKVAMWVYIVVAICIVGGMIGTLTALYFVHRRERDAEREKRVQYWREQAAFRQNIMQMRETARNSLLSLPQGGAASQRSSHYSENDQSPMLQHASRQASGLRNQYSDDGNYSDDGHVVMDPHHQAQGRF